MLHEVAVVGTPQVKPGGMLGRVEWNGECDRGRVSVATATGVVDRRLLDNGGLSPLFSPSGTHVALKVLKTCDCLLLAEVAMGRFLGMEEPTDGSGHSKWHRGQIFQ